MICDVPGWDETVFWLTSEPTVGELRMLNCESWYAFPLPMLDALITAGANLEALESAVIKCVPYETPEFIDMQYLVIHAGVVEFVLRHAGEKYSVLKRKRTHQAEV